MVYAEILASRSSRNLPSATAAFKSLFVARIILTSTISVSSLPNGFISFVSINRKSLAWHSESKSPISSRKRVPPAAVLAAPWRFLSAPENDPFSCPNSSLTKKSPFRVAQFMGMNFFSSDCSIHAFVPHNNFFRFRFHPKEAQSHPNRQVFLSPLQHLPST